MAARNVFLLCGLFLITIALSHAFEHTKNNVTVIRGPQRRLDMRPKTTRTELKVSRSLNPEETQTLNVMTKSGQVAQLIVKKRDGRATSTTTTSSPTTTVQQIVSSTVETVRSSSKMPQISSTIESANPSSKKPAVNSTESVETSTKPFVGSQPLYGGDFEPIYRSRKLDTDQERRSDDINEKISNFNRYYLSRQNGDEENPSVKAEYGNWSPVAGTRFDTSQSDEPLPESSALVGEKNKHPPVYITSSSYIESRSRNIDLDAPGIVTKNDRNPVHIEVVSTKVKEDSLVPAPVVIQSDTMFINGKPDEFNYRNKKSVLKIGEDGIPEIHGVRVPDDESDEKTWRNARVINGELFPYPVGYKPKAAFPDSEILSDLTKNIGPFVKEDNFQESIERGIGPFTTYDNFKGEQTQTRNNIGPFLTSDNPTYTNRNRIATDYLRKGFGPFTKTDNSRVANSKLIEYIKQINDHESRRDYFGGRTSRAEKDAANNVRFPDGLQRRMLQHPGNAVYPPSQMYTPKNSKIAPVAFSEGVRNPVLQYAHPDLGVQPAKTNQNVEESERSKKPQKIVYYSQDPHSDRSPFAVEPAMSTTENYGDTERRQSKEPTYRKNKYYDNSDYNMNRFNYYRHDYGKYPYNYGYIKRMPEPPLWRRITDTMKDTLQSGIETVQQFTRPVFEMTKPIFDPIAKVTKPVLEPLMEATQKISHNLGFSAPRPYYGQPHSAQDKIGTVAGTGSVLLPALGLMAGGAALGLGAVAVGRFLDVDLMRSAGMSEEDILKQLQMEHKRSLENAHMNYFRNLQREDVDKETLMKQAVYSDNVKMPSENIYVVMEAPESSPYTDVRQRRMRRSLEAAEVPMSQPEFVYRNDKFDVFSDSDSDSTVGTQTANLQNEENISRRRRSLLNSEDEFREEDRILHEAVQSLEQDRANRGLTSDLLAYIHSTDWTNTPCAKKTFCEVMRQQPPDELFQMEKKMDTLLKTVHPLLASSVSEHLSDVMAAIKRHDCSEFVCHRF